MTWKKVILGDIVTLQRGYDLPGQDRRPGQFSVVGSAGQRFVQAFKEQVIGVVKGWKTGGGGTGFRIGGGW